MKIKITQSDLENPQRFIGEGLGAPEFEVVSDMEAKAQQRTDCIHCLCTN